MIVIAQLRAFGFKRIMGVSRRRSAPRSPMSEPAAKRACIAAACPEAKPASRAVAVAPAVAPADVPAFNPAACGSPEAWNCPHQELGKSNGQIIAQ